MRLRAVSSFVVLASLVWTVAAGFSTRADARCAPQGLAPRVLTPVTASLPRDGGGIVVAMVGSSGGQDVAMPSGVQLVRGRRTQDLVARELAPGLVRFAAATRLTPGTFNAPALGPTSSIAVGRTPLPGVPTRPSVTELRRVAATGMSSRRTPRTEVRATLEFPVPAGIVAIVVGWGEDGAPAAWQPAIEGQREVVVWSEPARCASAPEGTIAPPEGEGASGRIAFVDAYGQVSPFSAPVPLR
ncbi:hypothetical protein [Sandaracinus amylolyticus]|uniref:hypothetical protein n=1 Tax=Sandaracinus amylolyticus TaxID=927083 RepID=UPI001F325745|nr:hypothetical protein [Sandaracinus amylolyticus]UJR81667.1 Hypothetical protein I5071_37270 [Sandaracinus amylolyticus]